MDNHNYVAHRMLDTKGNLDFSKEHCQVFISCVAQLIELQQQVKYFAPYF